MSTAAGTFGTFRAVCIQLSPRRSCHLRLAASLITTSILPTGLLRGAVREISQHLELASSPCNAAAHLPTTLPSPTSEHAGVRRPTLPLARRCRTRITRSRRGAWYVRQSAPVAGCRLLDTPFGASPFHPVPSPSACSPCSTTGHHCHGRRRSSGLRLTFHVHKYRGEPVTRLRRVGASPHERPPPLVFFPVRSKRLRSSTKTFGGRANGQMLVRFDHVDTSGAPVWILPAKPLRRGEFAQADPTSSHPMIPSERSRNGSRRVEQWAHAMHLTQL